MAKRFKIGILVLSVVLFGCGVIFVWNHQSLQAPMNDAVASDPRNRGLEYRAYFKNYVDSDILVINLVAFDGDKAPVDILRSLLQFAERIESRRFESVELARRGETRFVLSGDYFQRLGVEYGEQNPVYTMRTLPENLMLPDGNAAFSRWTGGVLGVTSKQMEDFQRFIRDWVS